jgi:hypothetical protein
VVLKALTDFENWQTETQYEDARIAKDFCFKLVNAYFACFFVAFVQNNFEVRAAKLQPRLQLRMYDSVGYSILSQSHGASILFDTLLLPRKAG